MRYLLLFFFLTLSVAAEDLSPNALLNNLEREAGTKETITPQAPSTPEKSGPEEEKIISREIKPPTISAIYDRRAGEKAIDDLDGDGLINENEIISYGTNPRLADTDGDGLQDGEEILCYRLDGKSPTYTNPLFWDTDGDGLKDLGDPNPLIPEMRLNFNTWTAWWKEAIKILGLTGEDLEKKNLDYDNDGYTNYQEFQRGSCPFLKPTQRIALFNPIFLTLSADAATTQTVTMTILSDTSVTGIFCASRLNLPKTQVNLLKMQGCELPDGLSMPSDMDGLVFLARYAVPLEMTVILPKASAKMPAKDFFRIKDAKGYWPDTLPIINPLKPSAPAVPELMMPNDSAEIMEEGEVTLLWQLDKEVKKPTYHLRVFLSRLGDLVPCEDIKTSKNLHKFKPDFAGAYFWQVAIEDEAGRSSLSQIGKFYYLPPSGMFDSDGDGVCDNDEILKESDPDDKDVTPLTITSKADLPKAKVKEYYSFSIIARGGVQPVQIFCASPRLPRGFLLDPSGVLLGLPEQAGKFYFTLGAKDAAGIVRKKIFSIMVEK